MVLNLFVFSDDKFTYISALLNYNLEVIVYFLEDVIVFFFTLFTPGAYSDTVF